MWTRRDWHSFHIELNKGWERLRPPRPVYRGGGSGVTPAEGYSIRELDDAGISLEQAERLGLPIDAGRTIAYGPNVSMLREFARAMSQQRGLRE
jgi:ribosomal protein L13E